MDPRSVSVTHTQYTVLRALLVDGASNAEIADRLVVSVDTVKTHLRRLYEKLDVRDRTGLAIVVWSGAIDIRRPARNGSVTHLLDELRVLQQVSRVKEYEHVLVEEEAEWPITLHFPSGTDSQPLSRSST